MKIASIFLVLFASITTAAFPPDFAWGVASAAYQIEGGWNADGKGRSIWDDFSMIPGRINNGDTGQVADDFYHRYQSDILLMKFLGITSFRMSISWPRILPDGTPQSLNPKGIQFYNNVIDALKAAGITPWVTLYHWDLPSALNDKTPNGGWLNPDITDQFAAYADICFSNFGDRVQHWVTFNEPQSICWLGYGTGWMAPGRCSAYMNSPCDISGGGGDSTREPYICNHHILIAHGKAAAAYKKHRDSQKGELGLAINSGVVVPYDINNNDDLKAAKNSIEFGYAYYYDPLVFGKYPDIMTQFVGQNRLPTFTPDEVNLIKGSTDFFGMNYYGSGYTSMGTTPGKDYGSDSKTIGNIYNKTGHLIGPPSGAGWQWIYPQGIRDTIKWISDRYKSESIPSPKVVVLENGRPYQNENDLPIGQAIHDQPRVDFINDHLEQIRLSVEEDKMNIGGYFLWAIYDNFEWGVGFEQRFGIIYVDYKNGITRYFKDSALAYSKYIKDHS